MALILARGRRRDRFGQCLVAFDDLPQATAEALVAMIAAALRATSRRLRPRCGAELAAHGRACSASATRARASTR